MPADLPCRRHNKATALKDDIINILIAGVGGQGVLLASSVLSEVFLRSGYDVKESCARGMAQRGGPLSSHIRIGRKVYSPLIPAQAADILAAMEFGEARRNIGYLAKGAMAIILDREICPGPVPPAAHSALKNEIKKKAGVFLEIPFCALADILPDVRASNIFLMGALSTYFSVNKNCWLRAIERLIPPETKAVNITAFEAGRERFGNAGKEEFLL